MFDKEYYLKRFQEENDPKNIEQLNERAEEYYREYEERKEQCRQVEKQYRKKNYREVRQKCRAERKDLGFILLNKSFEGSEGHHISKNFIIFIPEEIHRSIRHNIWSWKGMDAINKLAVEFL